MFICEKGADRKCGASGEYERPGREATAITDWKI